MQLLNQIARLSPECQEAICNKLERIELPKKSLYIKEGLISRYICFIVSGMVRSYDLTDGKEYTNYINCEGDIFYVVQSFDKQRPSTQYIMAVEDTLIYRMSYEDITDIYAQFPEFLAHKAAITQKYYEITDAIAVSLRKKKPEDMYAYLMEHRPAVMLRIPGKYIASYMGVCLRTYNKIKKNYCSRKH